MSVNQDKIEILTKDDVLKIVQEFSKDDTVEVEDYSVNPYSEHKLGHMGSHLQLTVSVKRLHGNKSTETHKFFVKAILQNSQTEIDFMNEQGIFTEEFVFFQKVKPLLMENYKGEAWSPHCYLAKKECLVMEDLRINRFALQTSLLDKTPQLKSALKALARFHACSIIAEARLSQLHKESISLNEYFPNNLKEPFFPDNNTTKQSTMHTLIENAMKPNFAVAKSLDRNPEKIRQVYEKLYKVVKPSKVHRNVICHGDLWANNLMFSDSEPEPQCVFVDFQTMRYATNVLDILQFIYLNTTSNYRKQHEQELIRVYSAVLESTILDNDETKTANFPTFEENLKAYKDLRYFGASIASLYLPFILMDQKVINELYKGADGFSNALYSDKTEMTFAYMKQNKAYKDRIEELVNELADIAEC